LKIWIKQVNYKEFNKALRAGKTLLQLQNEKFDFMLSHDKTAKNKFYNKVLQFRYSMQVTKDINYIHLKGQAARLIKFLAKQYNRLSIILIPI
jgi:hypothetical protein